MREPIFILILNSMGVGCFDNTRSVFFKYCLNNKQAIIHCAIVQTVVCISACMSECSESVDKWNIGENDGVLVVLLAVVERRRQSPLKNMCHE